MKITYYIMLSALVICFTFGSCSDNSATTSAPISNAEYEQSPEASYYNAYSEVCELRQLMRRGMLESAIQLCDNTVKNRLLSKDDRELFENTAALAQEKYNHNISGSGDYENIDVEISQLNGYIEAGSYADAAGLCVDILDNRDISLSDILLINTIYADAYNKNEAYTPYSEMPERYYTPDLPYVPDGVEGLGELAGEISAYISKRSGSWGVYVKNLKSGEYLVINEKAYSPASLIKLSTMAAVFDGIAQGSIDVNGTLKRELKLMICESSNTACNSLTKKVGRGNTVAGFDAENKLTGALGCTLTGHNSELVDGTGRRVIYRASNRSSPMDCGRILESIYTGTLVSRGASAEMLSLLKEQTRVWKIPSALPQGTLCANKTGENDNVEADAAIVFGNSCDYILCVIGNGNVRGGTETIRHISARVYEYLNEQS